jgi:hypothetical protein
MPQNGKSESTAPIIPLGIPSSSMRRTNTDPPNVHTAKTEFNMLLATTHGNPRLLASIRHPIPRCS